MKICNRTFIWIEETDSTNNYLKSLLKTTYPEEETIVLAHRQTSGKGQAGNHWESDPGMNLTFSLLIFPSEVPPGEQFILSQIISLSILDILSEETPDISIKWPNDIYYRDHKICGILIENEIEGNRLGNSIIGAGINVNQTIFRSNAPNPISLKQITGKEYDLPVLLERVVSHFFTLYDLIKKGRRQDIITRYRENLYHGHGFHDFSNKSGPFSGKIKEVLPNGCLVIETHSGEQRSYAFKEISFKSDHQW